MKRIMKNYAFMFLAAVMLLSACEKEVITEPVSEPKNLTVFSDNIIIPSPLLSRMDPVSGDTYLEVWQPEPISGQKSYVPYLQRLGKDGKQKWNQWLPLTRKPGLSWANETVFDTTSDGCVIDGFSVVGQNGKSQVFITKINPDGTYAWGSEGKLFYDFGDQGVIDVPCESFVVADKEGGAWIAAGNGARTLVIARVDKDGNFIVDPIVFFNPDNPDDEDGTFLRHPQMYVGADNSLIALLQYSCDISGGGGRDVILEGRYDVVKIPADGNPGGIIQNRIYDEDEMFHPGMRALLTEDGNGGAYAIFQNGTDEIHAYLYHFDSNANIDVRHIDIYPSGSQFLILDIFAAADPKTGNLAVLFQDILQDENGDPYSNVNLQVIDTKGNLKFEDDGKNIFKTKAKDSLWNNMTYFVHTDDGRWIFTFLWEMAGKSNFLYKSKIDIDKGEMQDVTELAEIDEIVNMGLDSESRMMVTDGFLRHLWYRLDGMKIYGYDAKI